MGFRYVLTAISTYRAQTTATQNVIGDARDSIDLFDDTAAKGRCVYGNFKTSRVPIAPLNPD